MRNLKLVVLCAILSVPLFAQEGDFLATDRSISDAASLYMNTTDRSEGAQIGYTVIRTYGDDLGQTHIRLVPSIDGLAVYGMHVIMHIDTFTRQILGFQNGMKPVETSGNGIFSDTSVNPNTAIVQVLKSMVVKNYEFISAPEKSYVVTADRVPHLAWNARIRYFSEEAGDQLDRIFVSAADGSLLARHPEYHYGRNRNTYSANNGTSLPGTLKRSETTPATGDACVDDAHDFAGDTYDFYNTFFNRDSLNNNGLTLKSTVHYSSNYNNAYWDGSQMVYGDGDGSTFICLARAVDVVAHELTHGVTEYTANLTYSNESGALNEAASDIMGAAIEAWIAGGVSANTWKLGEAIYTPGTSGDALRYMNNPTIDGQSTDYYPERYTGTQDNGGVHLNSGIANLYFYLLSQGGTHPRGKTSTVVSGIGITDAAAIWYRGLSVYMGPSTTFAEARANLTSAAEDLFGAGSTQATQVGNAWTAVGVSGPAPTIEITNGQTVSNLSAATGDFLYYKINIPSGASNFVATISGGSGDADLYTQFASKPTTSSYICRPYANGNSETCTVASPSAGYYYIGIRAYSSFSGLSLTASYSGGAGNAAPSASFTSSVSNLTASFTDHSTDSDGTIASRSWAFGDGGTSSSTNPSHTYASAGTYTVTLTVTDNDGASDSASASVTVTSTPTNTPPTANFTSSTNDLTASFTSTSSDPDGSIVSYAWSFGDGGTSTSQNPSHTYAAAGTYSVSLTVTDNGGATGSKSANVTVTAPPTGNGELVNGQTVTGLSGATGAWEYFFISVPSGATNLVISMSGGTGDADLYTRFGAAPTTSTYDCRPYVSGNTESCSYATTSAGDYHIGIQAYSSYSGVSLTVSYTEPSGGGGTWQTIVSTDFESGWGGFTDGGGDCFRSSSDSAYAYSGIYCIRLQDNSGDASAMYNSLNLSSYSELRVQFVFIANSMENGEDFFVEVKTASGWQKIATYARGTSFNNGTRYSVDVPITSAQYGFNIASGGVKIRCDASANSDMIYIDDVVISAK